MRMLPAITTTKGSDWKEKIKEADQLGLKEACFFLTCLDPEQRKEFYDLIEKSNIKEAPFVHLRNDMELWEINYLIKKYKTRVFNIHSRSEYPALIDYSKYKDILYIENIYMPLNEEELREFGGICLDFTHLENDRLTDEKKFNHNMEVLEKYPIGCNHISAIRKVSHLDENGYTRYDKHSFENLSEFDYLKKYPKHFFSNFIALEVENPLKDQLKAIEYIASLFS